MKKCLVVGSGITGCSSSEFLCHKGFDVVLFDDRQSELTSSISRFKDQAIYNQISKKFENLEKEVSMADFIVVSPGLRSIYKPHDIFAYAKKHNKPILTDIHLLFIFFPSCKYIGITGSNGKSTTSTLLYNALKKNNIDVFLCGNIGIPALSIDREYDYVIIELSSYQIEKGVDNFFIGCLLNISPTHLDHHGNLENYLKSKLLLLQNSQNKVINASLKNNMKNNNGTMLVFSANEIINHGFSIVNGSIYEDTQKIEDLANLTDNGRLIHQPENICAMLAICKIIGISTSQAIGSVSSFIPIAHRMEHVRAIGRIDFINDSKSTNIPAAISAIKSSTNPVLIICGDLLTDYSKINEVIHLVKELHIPVFLTGKCSDFISDLFNKNNILHTRCEDVKKAVFSAYKKALQLAKNNRTKRFSVLFSPMHPSFDSFKNFEERGAFFIKTVNEINSA